MESDQDCIQQPIEGFCITRDDFPDRLCIYTTSHDTGATNSCDDHVYGQCSEAEDCPTGMFCGLFAQNWCADGFDNCGPTIAHPCESDSDCTLDRPNVCQICGNGILEQSETDCVEGYRCQGEECDDGNELSGDGCSNSCKFDGHCVDQTGYEVHGGFCANAADCSTLLECTDAPCTCQLR